ncbi:ralfl33 precursor [Fusarium beomiforme]|uniref:Ralfl33 n=1 Tax=Fusarium beomiforme TaxID=44412 RepID=A0A9P5ATN9_9HYPO|nr:ralfl33 precursor [Fusarium beomiforme]
MKFSLITLSLISLIAAAPVAEPQSGTIGYGALKHDNVPCSVKGAAAANCRPGGDANSYHRGCSAITGCRGDGLLAIEIEPLKTQLSQVLLQYEVFKFQYL